MKVEGIASRHLKAQELFADWMISVSFVCAICCVLVLYFDWLEWLGHWSVVLILPLPAYTLFSLGNFWWFHALKEEKMDKYKEFVREFETDEELELPELPEQTNGNGDSKNPADPPGKIKP